MDINSPAVTELWAAKNKFKYRALASRSEYAPIVAFENDRNQAMTDKVLAIVQRNRNKRILVAVGIDHKWFIEERLSARGVHVAQVEDLTPPR